MRRILALGGAAMRRTLALGSARMRRMLVLGSGLALLLSLSAVVLDADPALAHGAMMRPGSRTFLCWRDGLSPQGNIVPINPACAAAVAQGGDNALYNWFGVLRSDGDGRTRGFIPDGQLCSGGNPVYSGFDIARDDFPVTHLTAGASFAWSYNAWAAHPGWFYMYVTKDTWSPTRPPAWSDLEEAPFLSADHPPLTGQVGTVEAQYNWTGNLPANKTGRHIIYSVWQRSDSRETFYGCSDVVFDGGNGEVTGVGRDNGTTSTTVPGQTTTTVPGQTTTTTPGSQACSTMYQVVNSWPGGFQADVMVHNNGTSVLNGWTASWTFPDGQTVTQLWNGVLATSGSSVRVTNESWNRQIPAGGAVTFGFLGTWNGTNGVPTITCTSP